ncbi:HNH endonuclease [Actinomycetospora endophytica]|uniref:HNH endonuclease n=1 Tax=Actinomycetospora endophytica TaxID=2291215 RepID=A0ABS8PB30_9PSEU|nr:HNH endonuclease [Actinomycetospora endophytica]MCD2195467.1 HNH endonuclease [Actinomycetospora endophytica]
MTAAVTVESAGGFDDLPAGPELAAALEAVDPASLVGEVAAAWLRGAFRVRNHADWLLLVTLREASGARAGTTVRADPDEFTPKIPAASLGWTATMAAARLHLAHGVLERMPALGAAMRAGKLEVGEASAFVTGLEGLSDEQARRVVDAVLPDIAALGLSALRERILDAAYAVDPVWAAARLAAATARARVSAETAPSGAVDLCGRDLDPNLAQAAKLRLRALALAVRARLRASGRKVALGFVEARVFIRLMDGTQAGAADDTAVIDAVTGELTATDDTGTNPTDDGPDTPDDGPDSPGGDDGPGPSGDDGGGPHPSGGPGPDDNGGPDWPGDGGPDSPGDGGPNSPGDSPERGPDGGRDEPDRLGDHELGPGNDDRGPGSSPHGDDGGPGASPGGMPGLGGEVPAGDEQTDERGSADYDDPQGPAADGEPHPGPASDPSPEQPPTESGAAGRCVVFAPGIGVRLTLSTLLGLDDAPGALSDIGPVPSEAARTAALARGAAGWKILVHDEHGHLQHLLTLRAPPDAARDPRYRRQTVQLTAPAALLHALDPDATTDADALAGARPVLLDAQITQWLARARDALIRADTAHPDDHPATTTRERDRRFPSTRLAEYVRARDQTCVVPTCTRPVDGCDLDHTLDWLHGGTTEAGDLEALCRHDHRAKHQAGWHYDQPQPGRFVITDPTGTRHHITSRITHPRPAPLTPGHAITPTTAHKPAREDWTPRRTRDGRITPEARDTATRLALTNRHQQEHPPSRYNHDPDF